MKSPAKLTGLIAAPHTPMTLAGEVNLPVIEKQAELLLSEGVSGVFIGGTTGECHSLSVDERLKLAERWSEVDAVSVPSSVLASHWSRCPS